MPDAMYITISIAMLLVGFLLGILVSYRMTRESILKWLRTEIDEEIPKYSESWVDRYTKEYYINIGRGFALREVKLMIERKTGGRDH